MKIKINFIAIAPQMELFFYKSNEINPAKLILENAEYLMA